MTDEIFAVDTEGWIQQNAGRRPWELFREILQNAFDAAEEVDEGHVEVEISTRKREVRVKDNGPGFNTLSDAWTVYGGDKGDDPTQRGRFSRGLKETVAGTTNLVLRTTAGTVEFQIDREAGEYDKFVDERECLENGTEIVAENKNWSTEDMQDMRDYLDKIWCPEGVEVTIDVSGGNTKTKRHGDPSNVFEMRLPTTLVENGLMKETQRTTDVNVRFAGGAGNKGTIYEMGIPVMMDWEVPYEVDIQQRVPMAEQRNEVDRSWLKEFYPKFLNEIYEHLPEKEMNANWVQEHIDSFRVDDEVKQSYIQANFNGDGKKDVVVASDDSMDDKAENHGYEVVDTTNLSYSMQSLLNSQAKTATDVAMEIMQREEEQVEPTLDQEVFVEQVRKILSGVPDVNEDAISFEFWKLAPGEDGSMTEADSNTNMQRIRLNTKARSWEEVNGETLSTIIHEVAHFGNSGHGKDWYSEMERIFAEVIDQHL